MNIENVVKDEMNRIVQISKNENSESSDWYQAMVIIHSFKKMHDSYMLENIIYSKYIEELSKDDYIKINKEEIEKEIVNYIYKNRGIFSE